MSNTDNQQIVRKLKPLDCTRTWSRGVTHKRNEGHELTRFPSHIGHIHKQTWGTYESSENNGQNSK
jgi:hypothetical protein